MSQTAPRLRQLAVNEGNDARLIEEIVLTGEPVTGDGLLRLWGIALGMAVRANEMADCAADQDLGWEIGRNGRRRAPADWLAADIRAIECTQDEYVQLAVTLRELLLMAFGATAILAVTPKRIAPQISDICEAA